MQRTTSVGAASDQRATPTPTTTSLQHPTTIRAVGEHSSDLKRGRTTSPETGATTSPTTATELPAATTATLPATGSTTDSAAPTTATTPS